ncbi:MAG TPA: Gfo/Idh/MocA family oxidoreductase [Gaiellales bacterium]|jgi:predicted dehydrogenase|nr:Gfo/Idh/MocA family oxidoreductase [Gaiellales bacterium]
MTPLRVGLLGGGWIARVHAPAIAGATDAELVAVCDLDPTRAQAVAEPLGAAVYTSWEEMLEREQLDALWVCTPPMHHRAPAEAALAAGLHVYLEKPVARTVADGEAIAEAAQSSRAVCAVGYQWHASELLERAREALDGAEPVLLAGRNFGPVAGRPWFMDQAQGGGQILERGSHHIDLQRRLAGEVASVRVTAARGGLSGQANTGIDEAIVMELSFASGTLGTVQIAWTRPGQPEVYSTDVLADGVTMQLELGPDRYRLTGRSRHGSLDASAGDPMERSIRRFLDAAAKGDAAAVACGPADAVRTLRVAAACELALQEGRPVAV